MKLYNIRLPDDLSAALKKAGAPRVRRVLEREFGRTASVTMDEPTEDLDSAIRKRFESKYKVYSVVFLPETTDRKGHILGAQTGLQGDATCKSIKPQDQ